MATRIFVTGPPGCGKTTVIKRVVEKLRAAGVPVLGFWTEEVRDGGNRTRIGFDLVTVEGANLPLARKGRPSASKVGGYGVVVENVDRVAERLLDRLPSRAEESVIVMDEVGPMELLSETFRAAVERCVEVAPRLIATVKLGHDPLGLLRREDGIHFEVTRRNRDALPVEIAALLA